MVKVKFLFLEKHVKYNNSPYNFNNETPYKNDYDGGKIILKDVKNH